jgi:uncharacterized membrane protein SirB2
MTPREGKWKFRVCLVVVYIVISFLAMKYASGRYSHVRPKGLSCERQERLITFAKGARGKLPHR